VLRAETDSNWSSGLSLWDWLHGTIRLDARRDPVVVGVPAYRDPKEIRLSPSLKLPLLASGAHGRWAVIVQPPRKCPPEA